MTALSKAIKLVSVNVGMPREIGQYQGRTILSGIYKKAVLGDVEVRRWGIRGDGQASPSVHGGDDMAAYVYPSEHYSYWRERFPEMPLEWGAFGENLTTKGLSEGDVSVGDRLRIGSAEFVVTKPRLPCFKLGLRFGTQKMVGWFLESGYTGFYVKVLTEGRVRAGDAIEWVPTKKGSQTISSVVEGVRRNKG